LIPLLQEKFEQDSTQRWLTALQAEGVPAGPINDIKEVLTNEHAINRKLVRQIQNSNGKSVPQVSNPVDFSATPVRYERAPPLLGEHTKEVLKEWLGYSDTKIETLRQSEVI
jgi:crotonobetainyl-CoA:carnitine CoA-transferase CaiB-like acyl-CoA transferase